MSFKEWIGVGLHELSHWCLEGSTTSNHTAGIDGETPGSPTFKAEGIELELSPFELEFWGAEHGWGLPQLEGEAPSAEEIVSIYRGLAHYMDEHPEVDAYSLGHYVVLRSEQFPLTYECGVFVGNIDRNQVYEEDETD